MQRAIREKDTPGIVRRNICRNSDRIATHQLNLLLHQLNLLLLLFNVSSFNSFVLTRIYLNKIEYYKSHRLFGNGCKTCHSLPTYSIILLFQIWNWQKWIGINPYAKNIMSEYPKSLTNCQLDLYGPYHHSYKFFCWWVPYLFFGKQQENCFVYLVTSLMHNSMVGCS